MVYIDSDWAGDKESRISIIGYILYFVGAPIAWRSKSQRNATLSSSEAEYVALSDCVRDIRFVMHLLTELGIKYHIPVLVNIDNVGAMFMVENINSSARIRHIDVQLKFVSEFVEKGEITAIFVRSEDNDADTFIRNTKAEIQDKLTDKFQSKGGVSNRA